MIDYENRKSRLILASGSAARAAILRNAGIKFSAVPPNCDEAAIKQAHEGNAEDLAVKLAKQKAMNVAAHHDETAYILAADQVLHCAGRLFDKATTHIQAKENLQFLRGRSHDLINGVVLMHKQQIIWQFSNYATLNMRDFSDEFLHDYMSVSGDHILNAVGAYQLEGMGVQLFDKIEGDYFTILGLPLLPLLAALRQYGIVVT